MANEIQQIDFSPTPTGGTVQLVFGGQTTSNLGPTSDTAGTVQAALESLSSIGSGNIVVTGNWSSGFTLSFQGALANTNLAQTTVADNTLTIADQTISVSTLTPGSSGGTQNVWSIDYDNNPADGAHDGTASFGMVVDGHDFGLAFWYYGSNASDLQGYFSEFSIDATITDAEGGGGTDTPQVITFGDYLEHSVSIYGDTGPGATLTEVQVGSGSGGTSQVDQISLPANTNGGTFHIGSEISSNTANATIVLTNTTQGLSVSGTQGDWADTGSYTDPAGNPSGFVVYQYYLLTSDDFSAWTDGDSVTVAVDGTDISAWTFDTSDGLTSGHLVLQAYGGGVIFPLNRNDASGTDQSATLTPLLCSPEISWNDDGTDVLTAVQSLLSLSGGSISASTLSWQYTYGTTGDMSSDTATLASVIAGDTLTQSVTVTPSTTQDGSPASGYGCIVGSPIINSKAIIQPVRALV